MAANKEQVMKALSALDDLAKGHAPGKTVSTAVDSMDGATPANQVFHTPSNSDPGSWAGSTAHDVPGNGTGDDGIASNGTDYVAASGMAKAIAVKLAKGQPLNGVERAFVEAGGLSKAYGKDDDDKDEMEKGMDFDADDKDGDKDKKKDMEKSLRDLADENPDVKKGLEVSDFLTGFLDVMQKSMDYQARSIVSELSKSINDQREANEEYQAAFAKSMLNLGSLLKAQDQRLNHVEGTPAGAPKSVQAVGVIEKSFGEGGAPAAPELSKSVVANALFTLMSQGKVSEGDVLRFDVDSKISDHNMAMVKALVAGK